MKLSRCLLKAKENGIELPDEIIEGTVGAVFSFDDAVSGPKIIKETGKTVEVLKLLGGIMDGEVLGIQEMNELAGLPSREQLLAKFMMMLRSPLQSFHGALSSPLSSMARALDAYAGQLPEEAAPEAPAKAEAPAPEPEPEKAEEAPTEEAPAEEESPAETPAEEETPAEGESDQS